MNWLEKKCEAVRRSTIRRGAIETVSGYAPLALPGSTGERIRMMTVYGRSVQAGTPAPDAPVSVVGVEGKCRSRGKNLFDKNKAVIINGYISTDAISTSNPLAKIIILPCARNTTYTVSKTKGVRFTIGCTTEFPAHNVPVYAIVSGHSLSVLTTTTTSYALYLIAWVYLEGMDSGTLSDMLASVQIEFASSPTPYAPYASPSIITHPTLHGIPLASTATDYTYIDGNGVKYAADTWTWREEGVWEHVQRVGKYVFTGVENWSAFAANENGTGRAYVSIPSLNVLQHAYGLSTHFLLNSGAVNAGTVGFYFSWENRILFCIPGVQTIEAFKAFFVANNVEVYYQLATPIVTQYPAIPWMHTIDASHAGNPLDVAYLDNVDGTTTMPWIQASYYKEVIL